jgi:2-polyprenyl-6-methoxyphenol hydroxylase-like FAD-dependent oxidoreductase
MKYTVIAIIGGGLAGSTAAAMLGRAGISAILIDPHPVYPSDFRVEKLSGRDQLERFRKTGLAEMILRAATHDGENWIARFGYPLDKRPRQQYGLSYDALVNAIRAASACVTSSRLRRLRNRLDAGPKFRTQSSSSSSSLSPSA